MRFVVMMLVVMVALNCCIAGTALQENISTLLPALLKAESHGNNNAVGDYGSYSEKDIRKLVAKKDIRKLREIDCALGPYQIHYKYWQDGCEYLGVKWSWLDAFDRDKSRQVTKAYLERYGKYYEKTQRKKANLKTLAKIHNGGLFGWKVSSDHYWNKVRKHLA